MLAVTLAAMVAGAGLASTPAPGFDYDSRVVFATPKGDNLPLLNLRPYPPRRVSSPDRPELGRVYVERTPGQQIAESVFPGPGPQAFGAEEGLAGMLIYAQTRYPIPQVAISPWQDIGNETFDSIRRLRPFISNQRRGEIIQDLRDAQQRWLRQNGYIRTVRTHVNDSAGGVEQGSVEQNAGDSMPSGVIRLRPIEEKPVNERAERSVPQVLPPIRDVAAYLAERDAASSEQIASAAHELEQR